MTTVPISPVHADLYRDHLERGHTIKVQASGGSMFPLIRDGDLLHVVRTDVPKRGDIVLYRRDGGRGPRWMAHRLIGAATNDGHLLLRGDAHRRTDPPVDPVDVVGRVTAVERNGEVISLGGAAGALFRGLAGVSLGYCSLLMVTVVVPARVVRRVMRVVRAGRGRL